MAIRLRSIFFTRQLPSLPDNAARDRKSHKARRLMFHKAIPRRVKPFGEHSSCADSAESRRTNWGETNISADFGSCLEALYSVAS